MPPHEGSVGFRLGGDGASCRTPDGAGSARRHGRAARHGFECKRATRGERGAGYALGQTGIQLYDFNNYLSSGNGQVGAGEITCPAPPAPATPNCVGPPAPTTQAARLERVLKWVGSKDIRNIDVYSYPGSPFPTATAGSTGNVAGMQALRAMGDKYGVRFTSRHGNLLPESNWDNQITASRMLGQVVVGESGLPNNTNVNNTWRRCSERSSSSTGWASAPWRPVSARRSSTTTTTSSA